jgi:hypothetical protein
MSELHQTAASLRFSGDDLDPDEISNRLGMEPHIAVRQGGTHFTPKGSPIIARTGMWLLKAERRSPGDLDDQILNLLAQLTEDIAIWTDLADRYGGHIFAGLFLDEPNEGMSLSPKTLAALGSRGLALQLDIYHLSDDGADPRAALAS